ncbi:flagellar biosynthetic protein FliR [uncultured Ferrovibrio sp.]|uniref:flagellar biosynthetic protein FliR n=1 Tax=uncultured Ferrovibrio sp. TaxID=1576913 RepID=UPI00260C2966|nr:flagellar biosynthetic protein FliR [uncultured Ferrovibrio sp.]
MLQDIVAGNVYAFILIFCRLGAAIMILPGIGESSVSSRARLAIALLTSGLTVPVLGPSLPPMPAEPFHMAFLVVTEVGFGLALGLMARLAISALHVAGTVIAMQAGLASAIFFDPNQGSQSALISSALVSMGMALIFVTDLHMLGLQAAYDSYRLFPPAQAPSFGDFAQLATQMVAGSFALGLKLAAPFIVYGIVFNVALGLLNRLMPTLQIFFVMQAPTIAFALVMLGLSLGAIGVLFTGRYEEQMSQFLVPR